MVFLNKYFTNIIHRQRFMKQQEIVKKIGVILKELQDQYQFIEKTKEPINDLELELFAANGNFLSDHIEILRKINEQAAKAQSSKKSHITEKFFEPVIQPVRIAAPEKKEITPAEYADFEPTTESETPVATEEHIEDQEEPIAEEPVIDEPIIRHELVLDDTDYLDDEEENQLHEHNEEENLPEEHDAVIDDDTALRNIAERFGIPEFSTAKTEPVAHFEEPETPAYTPPEPEMPTYTQPEPEVTARPVEDFNKPPLTLNQILSAQLANATRLSEQLSPIKDLRSAINLNDKMLYVKDLFNGYSLSYSEAIEILNRMDSYNDADHFLRTNYVTKNRWEEKQATADKFYALLKRRFA
jgi:hypothetical protein